MKGLTILIAEDDRTIRKMLTLRLEREGYRVQGAEDGKKAIEILEESLPDLIITDLMMPFKNGFEVVEFVKSKDENIPIIVLTSAGEDNTMTDAFNLKVDDFVTKPFNPTELFERIKRLLKV